METKKSRYLIELIKKYKFTSIGIFFGFLLNSFSFLLYTIFNPNPIVLRTFQNKLLYSIFEYISFFKNISSLEFVLASFFGLLGLSLDKMKNKKWGYLMLLIYFSILLYLSDWQV
jgi:hypothetical protein